MQHSSFSFQFSPAAFAVIAACVLAAGGALVFSGASRAADEPKAGQPRPALTVSTAAPQRTAVPVRLAANGNVAAWQEASIGAESNGLRLTDVRVNVGDTVKAGQVLATFSAETIQADVAQARASLLEAQANAAEAAANAERARSLQATGALSQQQIQQYTTAEKTAQARVEAAQATLNAQKLRLKYTQVVAPDSGVISARTATVGAVVGSGTELFRMVRKGRLEWRAEVTSTELRRIQPGVKATVTAASGATAEGTVRMVAPTVDPQTRNALVYVDLPAHSDFRAGMFARGRFLVRVRGGRRAARAAAQGADRPPRGRPRGTAHRPGCQRPGRGAGCRVPQRWRSGAGGCAGPGPGAKHVAGAGFQAKSGSSA
jgi:HlyD family secretion protein